MNAAGTAARPSSVMTIGMANHAAGLGRVAISIERYDVHANHHAGGGSFRRRSPERAPRPAPLGGVAGVGGILRGELMPMAVDCRGLRQDAEGRLASMVCARPAHDLAK